MNIDQDKLDALERDLKERLTRDIKADVEARLFRKYLAMGAFVVGTLGLFGFSTINAARTAIERAAYEQVETAQRAVTEANAISKQSLALVKVNQSTIESVQNTSTLLSTQATGLIERTNRALEKLETLAKTLPEDLTDARVDLETLKADLSDTAKQSGEVKLNLAAIQSQRADLAGAGSLDTLKSDFQTLNSQMIALSEAVKGLSTGTDQSKIAQVNSTLTTLAKVLENPGDAAVDQSTPLGETRVFVQFATVPRHVMTGLISSLDTREQFIKEKERIESARNLQELRYYFPEDKEAAQTIVDDLNAQLRGKYDNTISLQSMVGFKGQKPRVGTLELWLEPKPV